MNQNKYINLWSTLYLQRQGAVKVFNRTSKFIYLVKDHKKEKYNLEKSYNELLIYLNDREHKTMKVAPFRAIMNYKNKDLINKI